MGGSEGRVIVFNGASSSGKSTVAAAFQRSRIEPWLHVSIDTFYAMLPQRFHDDLGLLRGLLAPSLCRCAAELARRGGLVLLDTVLLEQSWYDDCRDALAGLPVLWVGVHCRIEEAERRESRRPDRLAGFARYQIPRVHAHRGLAYDIEIDTSLLEPEAAAREVGRAIPALSRSAGDCCQP